MANMHGDFIWYELMTTDRPGAEAFYGSVVGWRFGGDDSYRHIEANEGHVGGIFSLAPEMLDNGARPGWFGYILVDDVDAMIGSITAAGGAVHMPARDMEGVGRMALVADPQGAVFYLIKPRPPEGTEGDSHAFSYDRPRIGHCAWNELSTSDPNAAKHFYGQRFGWVKDGEMDMGELGKYEFLRHTGQAPEGSAMGQGVLGAVMPMMPGGAPVPLWNFYFRVPDIDAAAHAIRAGNGSILQEPMEIPGGEFSLMAADPAGAAFGLVGPRTGA
jgi:predicted enzyme related to lactoylglutathione lyase